MSPGSGDRDTREPLLGLPRGRKLQDSAAGVELQRRELHTAPGGREGRAELGFLEERRKLCPFLEVAEAGHREKRMNVAAGTYCQVKPLAF